MKVSIITATYNSEKTIEDTIKSVLSQSYTDIEYIIIDGASTDGTLNIVEKYKNQISIVVSEKDAGIYDAMNKGIHRATGDIVGILNSDDIYESDTIIEKVVREIETNNVDCVWGDLLYVDRANIKQTVRYWQSSIFKPGKFKLGWHPPHPTFFVKRNLYEKFGLFRLDLPIAADYELMLRLLEKQRVSSSYIHEVLVRMRVGGESNKNIKNIIQANKQCLRAFKINNIPVYSFIFFLKPLLKIPQFFMRKLK